MSWLVPDERDDEARAMALEVSKSGAVVPILFRWELQNALIVAVRRGRCTNEVADARLDDSDALNLVVDTQIANAPFKTGLGLARRFAISAYDACYLELAVRLARPLMTRDKHLTQAARESGVLWLSSGPSASSG
jgi:predicted nucleic acid-binding protein